MKITEQPVATGKFKMWERLRTPRNAIAAVVLMSMNSDHTTRDALCEEARQTAFQRLTRRVTDDGQCNLVPLDRDAIKVLLRYVTELERRRCENCSAPIFADAAICLTCAEKLEELDGKREARVADWVRTRIGEVHMHRRERAMRTTEEVIELAQAEGISKNQVLAQVEHVFSRAVGEPSQEAAGVAVCLLGWCAATGNKLTELADREIERIEAKPLYQIRGSVARKSDTDLVIAVTE